MHTLTLEMRDLGIDFNGDKKVYKKIKKNGLIIR